MIGLITTLHGRPEITRIVLSYYRSIGHYVGCAAFSDAMADLPEGWSDFDFEFVEHPNRPLSDKFNAAARLLRGRGRGVEFALVIGSDDCLSLDYIDHVASLVAKGHDYVRPTVLHNLDMATGRIERVVADHFGAGQAISRKLLYECGFEPWMPSMHNNDRAIGWKAGRLANAAVTMHEHPPMMALKTSHTLVPWGSTAFCKSRREITDEERDGVWLKFPYLKIVLDLVTDDTPKALRPPAHGHERAGT